ncbi:MAG: hypothetical protein AAGG38_08295 [Planctomycetota bacterium]
MSRFLPPAAIFCLCLSVIGGVTVSPAAADTAADLATLDRHLKRAQANLDAVHASIGHRTRPPKGSAAKLARSRLEQAQSDLEPAGQLAAALPAEAPGVADATARYQAALALYTRLQNILTGGTAAADSAGEAPPRSGEVELGHPHADNLKNALFTLRNKIETPANQLTQLHAELLPTADPLTINHRTVAAALATLQETRRQAGFVEQALAPLPPNGRGVPAAHQRLAAARQQLDDAEQYLLPLHARLTELVDPANYPAFEADRRRLADLGQSYAADYLFQSDRPRVAELYRQRAAAQQELVRVAQAYQRLMQQQTDQGQQIEAVGNGTLASFRQFDTAVAAQQQSLSAEIREHLANADGYATQAVQNQKPLWFTGGIPQEMGFAADKLALLTTLAPAQAASVQQEFDAMQASLRRRADSLKALIIRENQLPLDRYAGEDRDAAVAVARSGWAVQQPDAQVLAVRVPAETWQRETKWQYSRGGTWTLVDRSKLQVRLLVADPDQPELAIDRPITVIQDHQAGNTMIGVPLYSFDDPLQPSDYLLREKIE